MRFLPILALLLAACGSPSAYADGSPSAHADGAGSTSSGVPPAATEGTYEVALLAGGCFWCMESAYDPVPGVIRAVSGYAGGPEQHPTYEQVSAHKTGHAEAVRVVYDPKVLSFDKILDIYFTNIDPFDSRGQFCDKGRQYRPAIFPMSEAQKVAAEARRDALSQELGRPFAVTIEDGAVFWEAEAYHQDFWRNNEQHYLRYRRGCGRDARLKEVWGARAGGQHHGG